MSLAPGTGFGPYLLAESIGVGGMGEVYRATDTNLKRDVAIKVLPVSFASDADRLARFQREAEVLAALNHVNIAHIYGLERSEGVTALVMELVDGQTLAERLERGALPADEALNIALQIAEALEAAHERGIVHRDLKPANIKLASNGVVKVLDFGIAKALDTKAISGPQAAQLTTPAMTEAGIVLGTAAYMSPEQARGKPVDQRTDIWAFGCVLYEMLTGQLAFGGEDVTTTLARILERGADMNSLPATLSPAVKHTLRLCLEKDPRKRIRHIGDVKLALMGSFESAVANAQLDIATRSRLRLSWSLCAAACLVAAALLLPTLQHLRETTPLLPAETRVDIVTPATYEPAFFALSPDGSQIVFVASGDGDSRLWLRTLRSASTTAQPLPGTEGAIAPFWSPDGQSVGFFTSTALKRLDLGGTIKSLANVSNGQAGSWNADGTILYAPSRTSPMLRVPAAGGEPTPVTTLIPPQQGHFTPHFLPDGNHFLFFALGPPGTAGIFLGALDGTEPVRLMSSISPGAYHPAGYVLWVQDGTLVAQSLDIERAVLTGEPRSVAEGLLVDSILNRNALSVSSAGQIAYRTGSSARRQLTWMDAAGNVQGTLGEASPTLLQPRLSPDGSRVAVAREVQGNRDLWLLDGARATRLTFDPAVETYPVWSPDGTRLAFRSNRSSAGSIYEMRADNPGSEVAIIESEQLISPTAWSRDGRFLSYTLTGATTNVDIMLAAMDAAYEVSVFRQTPAREVYAEFSPDGRWMAYQSNETGSPEIYVRSFVAPGSAEAPSAAQWQISTDGGITPLWSRDGTALYYVNPRGDMMRVAITATATAIEPGVPEQLFHSNIFSGGNDLQQGRQFDVSPDGRFLINASLDDVDEPITLIQNWNPEAAQ